MHDLAMISKISYFSLYPPKKKWMVKSPRDKVEFPPGQEHHGSSIGQLAAVARRGAATSLEGLGCGASMCFKPLRVVAIIHS